MGTRWATQVFEGNQCILTTYGQLDGYLSGAGKDLAEFVDGRKITNGVGCFAAGLVANFKTEAGGFYVRREMTELGDQGEEFIYRFDFDPDPDNPRPRITVLSGGVTFFGMPNKEETFATLFSGTFPEFVEFIREQMEKEAAA